MNAGAWRKIGSKGLGALRHPSRIRRRIQRISERQHMSRTRWETRGDLSVRQYGSYDDYVQHQSSKLDVRSQDVGRYNAELREALTRRLDGEDWQGARVLCLAARLGGEVEAFRSHGAFAVGIDLNPGRENPYVLAGDFHNLRFPDDCVDVVFTNSLDHALELDRLAGEARRVLRPGGRLIVEAGDFDEMTAGGWEVALWSSADGLVRILEGFGFRCSSREAIASPWPGTALHFETDTPTPSGS